MLPGTRAVLVSLALSLLPIAAQAAPTVVDVSAGVGHTCAQTNDGVAWCWGKNSNGELADGTTTGRLVPTVVAALGTTALQVQSNGGPTSCARLSGGTLSCWGDNAFGQVGDNTTTDRLLPVPVTALGNLVTNVFMGDSNALAVTVDRTA
jgi:alpha-tubulin suppressor-like RCC1 family protein